MQTIGEIRYRMIFLKSSEHIEFMKVAGRICADTLDHLSLFCKPGATGVQLDKIAEEFIRDHGATPSCLGYRDYPASTCISINSQCVHCIPNNTPIKEGDIVKLDLVVNYKGWNADSALTIAVPPVKSEVAKFVQTTYLALQQGILQAKEGNRVSDISKAVFDARNGYGVVKEFIGHGIGKDIHEQPQIPNMPVENKNDLLVAGMAICIEPIFTLSPDASIFYKEGQWDTWALSGSPVSHFEHTLIINPSPLPPTILTLRNTERS